MRLQLPGRATFLDQLRPGACFLAPAGGGARDRAALGLLVCDHGQRRALMLERDGGPTLVLLAEEAMRPDVFELTEAVLMPGGGLVDLAFGCAGSGPSALYLGDGCAYLRARGADGALRTFEVAGGMASAVDLAYLPRVERWRIVLPDGAGPPWTLFAAG